MDFNTNSLAENYAALIASNDRNIIFPQNLSIKIANTNCSLLLDSGSAYSIWNILPANNILFNSENAKLSEKRVNNLRTFRNEKLVTLGSLKTPVQ